MWCAALMAATAPLTFAVIKKGKEAVLTTDPTNAQAPFSEICLGGGLVAKSCQTLATP